MDKQQVGIYMRVGSEEQARPSLKDQLESIREEIQIEEEVMKALAAGFQDSSEKYNKLRMKQRSLLGQLYTNTKKGLV